MSSHSDPFSALYVGKQPPHGFRRSSIPGAQFFLLGRVAPFMLAMTFPICSQSYVWPFSLSPLNFIDAIDPDHALFFVGRS